MKKPEFMINRRHMLKQLGFGSMACLFSGFTPFRSDILQAGRTDQGPQTTFQKITNQSSVSLFKGNDCRDITFTALKNIEDNIMSSLEGKKSILIKPNIVLPDIPLCATHVDSVRGILDFFRTRCKAPIVVGESTADKKSTMNGFSNYGYFPLEKEYGIKLCDLNEQSYVYRYVLGPDNTPQPVRIISTFFDSEQYIISAAKMKTHGQVLVTLSLKNFLLGAPLNDYQHNDKANIHRIIERTKTTMLHYNMFRLSQEIFPDLGVIDGFEAMEGNGPIHGTPVDARIVLASLDPLALDTLTTKLMGFDPTDILYLSSMNKAGLGQGDLDKIKIIGTDLQNIQYHFKPPEVLAKPFGLR